MGWSVDFLKKFKIVDFMKMVIEGKSVENGGKVREERKKKRAKKGD